MRSAASGTYGATMPSELTEDEIKHGQRIDALSRRINKLLSKENFYGNSVGDCIIALLQCITHGFIALDSDEDKRVLRSIIYGFAKALYDKGDDKPEDTIQ